MKTKPLDFVVIGAPRAGSTTLFHYLRQHPQIYIPPAKELPFFSEPERFERGWDWFVAEFFSRASLDALWGKVSPQYMEDDRVPQRLFKALPVTKLIALLRNPVDRAFSHYRFLVRRGVEPISFEEAFFTGGPKDKYYRPTGEYGRILKNYLTYFPADQLLVVFTDDLERRPQYVIDTVTAYLGLEPGFSPSNLGKRYNKGGTSTRFPWLIPTVQKISPLRWLWQTAPEGVRRGFGRWYFFEIAPRSEPAPVLQSDLRQKLVDFYRPQVQELEYLTCSKVPWQEFQERG